MKFKKTMVVAHRGASGHAPENTLLAFQKAIDIGADCIETDIRRTKDGIIVLFHDENQRQESEMKSLLKNCSQASKSFQVPTLEEGLAMSRKILIDIEFKKTLCAKPSTSSEISEHDEFFIRSLKIKSWFRSRNRSEITTALLLGRDKPENQSGPGSQNSFRQAFKKNESGFRFAPLPCLSSFCNKNEFAKCSVWFGR